MQHPMPQTRKITQTVLSYAFLYIGRPTHLSFVRHTKLVSPPHKSIVTLSSNLQILCLYMVM